MDLKFRKELFLVAICMLTFASGWVARSRSYVNEYKADLFLDPDPNTCFRAGYGVQEWATIDFGEVKNVAGVHITGNWNFLNIRIGDANEPYALRGGFDSNAFCATIEASNSTGVTGSGPGGVLGMKMDVVCQRTIPGRILSILQVDPSSATQLKLCDVVPVFA